MTGAAAPQAAVCQWPHPHGPHQIPALFLEPGTERVLHLDSVNTLHCGGRPR